MDLTSDERLAQCRQWILAQFQLTRVTLTVVSGDASFRRYFRFRHHVGHSQESLIVVDAPPDKEDSRPFVAVSAAYAAQGLNVPRVICADLSQGFMCLTDLGDELLLSALNQHSVDDYYQKALNLLPDIAAVRQTPDGALPPFDETLLRFEMSLLNDWLFPHHLQFTPNAAQQQIIEAAFTLLVDNALAQPQVGVHRDFHCRNLMLTPDNDLAVIDYQDAVTGPVTYDAVSLLRDCYIRWPDPLVYRHLLRFKQTIGETVDGVNEVSDATFIRWFDLTGMQRHIKVCGIFARLYYRDGKSGYLDDIPRVLDYLIDIGKKYPEFADFIALMEGQIKPLLASVAA